jgi:hypothetical protein
MAAKQWKDLAPGQRKAIMVLASAELSLTATAAVDLARRGPGEVRGGRRLWWPLLFVQPFGPLLYLFWARRPR